MKSNKSVYDGTVHIDGDFWGAVRKITQYVFEEILLKNKTYKWLDDSSTSALKLLELAETNGVKLGPHFYPATFVTI